MLCCGGITAMGCVPLYISEVGSRVNAEEYLNILDHYVQFARPQLGLQDIVIVQVSCVRFAVWRWF